MDEVTRLLDRIREGQQEALSDLFPIVYDELRRIAGALMARENPGHTLQPTALVNEAFLRLVAPERRQDWSSSRHFFAVASEVMRHLLVDRARRKKRIRHGGELQRHQIPLEHVPEFELPEGGPILSLHAALEELERDYPAPAKLVVLRYFGGLTIEQACDVIGISRTTAHRHWTWARAWLFRRVQELEESGPPADGDRPPVE